MTIFDRLSDRVDDFLEEVMLPEEIHALHRRARGAIEQGDYQTALEALGEAEHRRPNTERTRRMRGVCYFHIGDIDRAIELFEEALELKEVAAAHFYLGLCRERKKQPGEALGHFRRALELEEEPTFKYDLHFGLGRVHLAMGRPDKAVRELRRALRIWPDQTDCAIRLAEALHRRGEHEEAEGVLQDAVGDSPNREALAIFGQIYAATDRPERAAEHFEQILEDDPDDRAAILGAARAQLAAERPERANRLLLRAVNAHTAEPGRRGELFALLGRTNEQLDSPDEALKAYDTALSNDEHHPEARLGAARTSLRIGNLEAATEHFEKLLDDPDTRHRAEALLGLGRCKLAMDDPIGARQLLEEAGQLFRERPPELLRALGLVAYESDDFAEALVAFRRALHQNPPENLREQLDGDIDRALQALQPDWTRPDGFDSTADLVASLSGLRDAIGAEPRLERFLPRVHDLLAAVDRPLSVAVLGEFNSGKSTLVNALLGEEVVPMGVLPTTAHPCVMGYGPRKGARVVYEDDRVRDVDFETARQLMKDEAEQIARLDYTYPHPELRSLQYLDTPGFNALDERHEALATQALEQTEAILWLFDANQALTDTEFSKLRSIPDSSLRVILVVNKTDRFGDAEQRREEVDEIVDYLEEHAGDRVLDILAISALEALEARTGEDGESAAVPDDFERLLELLDERFVQRSWEIKISEVSRGLDELLDEIDEVRSDELAHFDGLIETAEQLGELIGDAAGDPRSRASEYALELEDRFDFVTLGIEREIEDALSRRGRIFSRTVLESDDRDFILELLEERLDDVIARTRRQIHDEISALESKLAERLSPLFASLSVTDARPLRRRLEGFFDETRALRTVLEERVFGQWRARNRGRIATGGEDTLDAIADLGDDADRTDRRERLRELIPRVGDDFTTDLADWYGEFFLAAQRFCNRLQRDLETLRLEVRHRLQFGES